MTSNIHRKRALTHRRTARDNNQLARLETVRFIVNVGESSVQAGGSMPLMLLLQLGERTPRGLPDRLIVGAYLLIAQIVGLRLRLVDNIRRRTLAISKLSDARARVYHLTEQRFIMHDMRVIQRVCWSGNALRQVG